MDLISLAISLKNNKGGETSYDELSKKLAFLADSDDETLDQMSEIVTYIKNNKSLIEDLTTGKISSSDIVNNLTTSDTKKPLSAAQGVILKKLIDAIIVPTKVSELENDKGYVTTIPSSDKTLSTDGGYADAKIVGEKIKELKETTFVDTLTIGVIDGVLKFTANGEG